MVRPRLAPSPKVSARFSRDRAGQPIAAQGSDFSLDEADPAGVVKIRAENSSRALLGLLSHGLEARPILELECTSARPAALHQRG